MTIANNRADGGLGRRLQGRGRSFEYRVRDHLRAAGYYVSRPAGSKGPYDLDAAGREPPLVVQCKTTGRLDPDGWNALIDAASMRGALPILAARYKRRVIFYLLTDRKDGSGRAQPRISWAP